ncbi:DsbA family oxidoreductase [Deinococcus maricopensis]|uniref:DSBA oxidoreductase n=1 Tax=Deinococcus maricopensis (strain DSM 21211 / LMG 22137 / NRRL B-23946 / LB-34) TaxID=709986 RepID=E8U5D8_DEIML|nr:DsbA family protein [Deinococcus maricopensis]ADV66277.1 DSBA oxidoreductase [Deinococcus maricopensis DSM 21211]
MTQTQPLQVYIDFLCPFAWRGVELALILRETRGLNVQLRHYSLVQGNHPENPDRKQPTWWLTDQTADSGSDMQRGSLAAFLAAHAAARQGEQERFTFTVELFRLRHQDGRALHDPTTLHAAAERAGLDAARFAQDLQDDAGLRAALTEDLRAAAALGVFGTPTFVLDGANAAYFRFARLPESPEAAHALWELYVQTLLNDARIETIKRPR